MRLETIFLKKWKYNAFLRQFQKIKDTANLTVLLCFYSMFLNTFNLSLGLQIHSYSFPYHRQKVQITYTPYLKRDLFVGVYFNDEYAIRMLFVFSKQQNSKINFLN